MAVTVTSSITGPYIPNGATTVFAFDFKAGSADEIDVYRDTGDGWSVIPSADYTAFVDTDLEGGTVEFTVAPGVGSGSLYIVSEPMFTREGQYTGEGPFTPKGLNAQFDKAAVRDIALKRDVGRSIKAPLGEEADLTLPAAGSRASRFLSFAADGQTIVLSEGTGADLGLRQDLAEIGGQIIRFGRTTVEARLASELYLTDYADLADGPDWTAAIQKAELDAYNAGRALRVPPGVFGYSDDISLRCDVLGSGRLSTRFDKLAAGCTIYHQNGCLRGLTIGPTAVIPGDSSHGLVLNTASRKVTDDVWVQYHGGDGVRFEHGNNCRLAVTSIYNEGRGVFFPAGNDGDNNTCDVWADVRRNGLAGFEIEHNANISLIAGRMRGMVIAQTNGQRAVVNNDFDVILAGRAHNLQVYAEYGPKSVWQRSSLLTSFVQYTSLDWTTFLNEADDTNVISMPPSAANSRVTLVDLFRKIVLFGTNNVGRLELTQIGDRAFSLDALGSGLAQTLALGSTLTIQKNGLPIRATATSGATLNFGSIGAGATVDRTLSPALTAALPAQVAVSASPRFAMPAGIVWSAFVTGGSDPATDPVVITVRCANLTSSPVAVNGVFNISLAV